MRPGYPKELYDDLFRQIPIDHSSNVVEIGNSIQIKELRLGTAPCTLIGRIIRIQIRLVPDFPVLDIQMKTICPAFIIMADDMLANHCSLVKILRWNGSVLLDLMFNRLAQPEECFRSGFQTNQNGFIRTGKTIRSRIVWICVEVWKNIRNIMAVRTAIDTNNAGIVIA